MVPLLDNVRISQKNSPCEVLFCPDSFPGVPYGLMDTLTTSTLSVINPDRHIQLHSRQRRVLGVMVALGSGSLLMVAAMLSPSEKGLGTHQQLMLPECGWITSFDLPCPTCGMTTAFSHAANGNLPASFLTQPLGALLALATAIAFLSGMFVAFTGSRIGSMFGRLWTYRTGWIIAGLVVVSWGYKVLNSKGVI